MNTAILVLVVPFLLAYAPQKINDYAYRSLSKSKIANYVAGNEVDDEEIIRKIFNFVTFNLTILKSSKLANLSPYQNLVRGISWCGQQDLLIMSLLDKKGIISRGQDVQNHTVTEVLLDGRWRLIDPLFEAQYYNKKGELAGHEEILSGYGTKVFSETVEARKLYNLPWAHEKPSNLYIPDPIQFHPDGQSPVFRELRKKNKPTRLIVDTAISLGLQVYGTFYSEWFQDRFLRMQGQLQDPGEDWFGGYLEKYQRNDKAYTTFFKARNFHLHQRYEKAIRSYDKVVIDFPGSIWADESEFFKGQLLFELKKYRDAINILSKIANNFEKQRSGQASHVLGLVFENLGDINKAKKYYRQSISDLNFPLLSAALNLYRLEYPQDIVRKLKST